MTKLQAFFGHLCLSLAVVGTVCAIIFFVWYPHPYFEAKGAWNVLRVLLSVDLVVGPVLTLILYRHGKRGLKIDMTFVAVVQIVALVYGTSVIYGERPYFAVFAVDRFEVIAKHEVDLETATDPRVLEKPFIGPRLVVALRPTTTEGMQKLLDDVIFNGKPDIERRPEFWSPYEDQTPHVLERVVDLAKLAASPNNEDGRIERFLKRSGRAMHELAYVPLIGQDRDFAFVVDKQTGQPLDIIDVNPWLKLPAAASAVSSRRGTISNEMDAAK